MVGLKQQSVRSGWRAEDRRSLMVVGRVVADLTLSASGIAAANVQKSRMPATKVSAKVVIVVTVVVRWIFLICRRYTRCRGGASDGSSMSTCRSRRYQNFRGQRAIAAYVRLKPQHQGDMMGGGLVRWWAGGSASCVCCVLCVVCCVLCVVCCVVLCVCVCVCVRFLARPFIASVRPSSPWLY